MPIKSIARVEVIRGPGSALYGADAFSGVINIITKNHDELRGTQTGIRTGSFGTQAAWFTRGKSYNGSILVSLWKPKLPMVGKKLSNTIDKRSLMPCSKQMPV